LISLYVSLLISASSQNTYIRYVILFGLWCSVQPVCCFCYSQFISSNLSNPDTRSRIITKLAHGYFLGYDLKYCFSDTRFLFSSTEVFIILEHCITNFIHRMVDIDDVNK
jgi:hypothetical protein